MSEFDTNQRNSPVGSLSSNDSGITLSPALAEARALTKTEILAKRSQHISKNLILAYQNTDPLYIKSGEGCYLIDENSKRYLDARNNVCHVGHQNPDVVKAVQEQVATLNTNSRYLHPNVALLAEKITEKMPEELNTMFFVNSGSEANDLALRLARTHTQRQDVIVLSNAYHGHTSEVLTISPYKYDKKCGPDSKKDFIHKVDSPDCHNGPFYNSDGYHNQVVDACSKNKIAAYIAESGLSIGGVVIHPENYLKNVYKTVRENGGVCIADEVQVGFGRYGTSFWGFEHSEVVPDIVTMGKPIGNGMPLACVCCTEAVATSFLERHSDYFNTYGGNPVSAAAGLAVMHVIERDGLQERARVIGEYFKQKFLDLQKTLPVGVITDVRGSGFFLGVQLMNKKMASALCGNMKNTHSILTSIDGPGYNTMVFKPPMYFTNENVDYVVACFSEFLNSIDLADYLNQAVDDADVCPT